MVFFFALTPLNLAAIGGGTIFTTLTGCVCMGCYSGDEEENALELQKDVEPLLKDENDENDIAPHFFAKNYKCYKRDPQKVRWSKIMYNIQRTVDTTPSDKWHPSPKLSAFSRTLAEPILYSIAVPKRCTFFFVHRMRTS